ncbi:hypothetical protein ACFLQU_00460 [Verrucomicrobiota bacterium]
MKRSEFIRGFGRSVALGVIGFFGIRAASRVRGVDREAHRCVNKSVCCGCSKFESCILPAAATKRLGTGRRSPGRIQTR